MRLPWAMKEGWLVLSRIYYILSNLNKRSDTYEKQKTENRIAGLDN